MSSVTLKLMLRHLRLRGLGVLQLYGDCAQRVLVTAARNSRSPVSTISTKMDTSTGIRTSLASSSFSLDADEQSANAVRTGTQSGERSPNGNGTPGTQSGERSPNGSPSGNGTPLRVSYGTPAAHARAAETSAGYLFENEIENEIEIQSKIE